MMINKRVVVTESEDVVHLTFGSEDPRQDPFSTTVTISLGTYRALRRAVLDGDVEQHVAASIPGD